MDAIAGAVLNGSGVGTVEATDAAAVHDALTLAASAIDDGANIDKGWRIVTGPSEPGVHKVEVECVSADDWEPLVSAAWEAMGLGKDG